MWRFAFLKLGDSQNHTLNHRFQYQVMIEFWWFEATPFQETAVSFTNKPWRIRMEHRQFFGKTSKTWDLTMNSGYLTSNHVYLMIVRWGVAPGIFWVLSKGYNGGCDKTYIKLQVRQNIHKASGAKICQSTRLEGFCGTWNSPKQMIGFGVSCSLQLPHGYIQRKPHMYEIEETTPKHIRTRISAHFAPKSNKLLKGSSLIILDWQKNQLIDWFLRKTNLRLFFTIKFAAKRFCCHI